MATEDDLRRLALALPETTERPTHGTPGFRVKDRLFATINYRYGEAAVVLWCHDLDEKDALLDAHPDTLFTKPHYDGHPSVLAHLALIGVDDLEWLLANAWRSRAPKELVAAFDAARRPSLS